MTYHVIYLLFQTFWTLSEDVFVKYALNYQFVTNKNDKPYFSNGHEQQALVSVYLG